MTELQHIPAVARLSGDVDTLWETILNFHYAKVDGHLKANVDGRENILPPYPPQVCAILVDNIEILDTILNS